MLFSDDLVLRQIIILQMPDKYGYISLTKLSLWLRNFLAAGQKQKYKYNLNQPESATA